MSRYILYITLVWTISIFLAPLTLEPHTTEDLDARANWIDYEDKWWEMAKTNPYAAFIYLLGDLNCHQRSSRSLYLNDNQLPVCARDVGISLGAVAGACILFFVIRTPSMFLTFLSPLPGKMRKTLLKYLPPWLAAILVAIPFLLPTGFDGFYQLLTPYESTNPIRLISGFFLGVVLAWAFGSAFLSVTVPFPPDYDLIPEAAPYRPNGKQQPDARQNEVGKSTVNIHIQDSIINKSSIFIDGKKEGLAEEGKDPPEFADGQPSQERNGEG